jgi:tetratricopeptide (TPR) repeat protein
MRHPACVAAGALLALALFASPARGAEPPLTGEAYQHAAATYRALDAQDLTAAEREARLAYVLRPDSRAVALLLVEVLRRSYKLEEARRVLDASMAGQPADAAALTTRGYLDTALNDNEAAVADFDRALAVPGQSDEVVRNLRLAEADAASSAKQPKTVLHALEPLAGEATYPVAIRRGYALFSLERYDEASDAFATAARTAPTDEGRFSATKGQAEADADRGDFASVKRLLPTLAAANAPCNIDVAYLMLRAGDDAGALAYVDGPCGAALKPANAVDFGYAAKRLGQNQEAISYFQRGLEPRLTGGAQSDADARTIFGLRREVDTLARDWGATGSFTFRGDRSNADNGTVGQEISEAYWQPPILNNSLQVYARIGVNAVDQTSAGTSSTTSTQAAFGTRYKPFSTENIVVAAERLVPVEHGALKDWLFRGATSGGFGLEVEPVRRYWPTSQYYVETDYYLHQRRFAATGEGRYGEATALLDTSPNLIGTAFLDLAAEYDGAQYRRAAVAGGPGVGVRYWFRETTYRAPASFVELDLAYRFNATGSGRLGGIVLQLILSF